MANQGGKVNMIRYWVVTDSYYIGAGDISETIEHRFETREKAEDWKREKDKAQENKDFMDKHRYRVEERKLIFEDDEEPIHDWGSSYHGEW
jgi:hypothetical protein